MNFDQSISNEFVTESREHIESVEKDLLELESQSGVVVTPILIGRLFRAMHSIKGAAGFLGFMKINKLAHTMETMLQMIRGGEITPETEFIDALLSGTDLLSTMLDDVGNSNNIDIEILLNRLDGLIEKTTSPQAKKEMDNLISMLDRNNCDLGFEISEFDIKNLPSNHEHLFVLQFDLQTISKDEGTTPVALIKTLLGTGMIINSKVDTPAEDLLTDMNAYPLYYCVLYSTIMPRDIVCKVAGLESERVVEVNIEEIKNKIAKGDIKSAPLKLPIPGNSDPLKLPIPKNKNNKDEQEGKEVAVIKSSNTITRGSHDHSDTIRIQVDILDKLMTLAGELVLVRNRQLLQLNRTDATSRSISQRLDIVTTELQETIMQTRMQPIGNIFAKIPLIVRDIARKTGKKIEVNVSGNEVELDKTIIESLADPLTHLIRNSCDHGIESPNERTRSGKSPTGSIKVSAYHEAGQINIEIFDDGKGIAPENIKQKALEKGLKTEKELSLMNEKDILSLIMLPGFSTANVVTDVSGRGVGMDVVRTSIDQLSGTLDIESNPGKGTLVHLRLPLTLAIIPCLVVIAGEHRYALPQVNLEELVSLYDGDIYTRIEYAGNQEVYRLRDHLLPMVRLSEILSHPLAFTEDTRSEITNNYTEIAKQALEKELHEKKSLIFAVLKTGTKRFGLIVDRVIGTEEIVVKPMHPVVKALDIYSGATVMGDGKVAMILDIDGIAQHAGVGSEIEANEEEIREKELKASNITNMQKVLLFKSSAHEQFALSLPLIRRIERIPMSKIDTVGNQEFITIEGISTLILRLDRHLEISPCQEKEEMFLLMPKNIKRPFGILMSEIIDFVEAPLELNLDSFMEESILGTAIVRDKMTLFIDIYRLIEKEEPDWFVERKRNSPPPMEKKHILLVEDTVFFRQLITRYLEADHYIVSTADNGQEGLNLLQENTYDLIISDIDMPIMDGWTFMQNVRKRSDVNKIPSIALTSMSAKDNEDYSKEVGFDKFEEKVDREHLLTCIAEILQKSPQPNL